MNLGQALGVAAAAWVTAMALDPSVERAFGRAQFQSGFLAAELEFAASSPRIKVGFCATPDGARIARGRLLR
jgi:hypothetical protein